MVMVMVMVMVMMIVRQSSRRRPPTATATTTTIRHDRASQVAAATTPAGAGTHKIPPPTHTVVTGYDVEKLVDAALGRCPMPMAPSHFDVASGIPLTRIVPALWSAAAAAATTTSTAALHQQQFPVAQSAAGVLRVRSRVLVLPVRVVGSTL
jgi:hypothetical protein